MTTQHFIIEGKHLGTVERGRHFVHGEVQLPQAYAFFCPYCAEIWARCPVDGVKAFHALTSTCRRHKRSSFSVPGSLRVALDDDFNNSFPPEVIRWEFHRYLNYYEGILA